MNKHLNNLLLFLNALEKKSYNRQVELIFINKFIKNFVFNLFYENFYIFLYVKLKENNY